MLCVLENGVKKFNCIGTRTLPGMNAEDLCVYETKPRRLL